MDDVANMLKSKIKIKISLAIATATGGCFLPLIIFVALISCLVALGLFDTDTSGATASSSSGTCSYNVNGKTVSNLKVRLLNCEGNTPVEGEELIDFETYITGVVYQEVGDASYEALKAQAVAARSFALARPKAMGNAYGINLEEEDGQWILSLRSCTNDQVFCNPDKGCWSNRKGGQTSNNNPSDWSNCTVHSGEDKTKTWSRGALSEDSDIRKAVEETKGQVLTNSKGNIVYTNFTSTNQTKWNKLAKAGKDYFSILVNTYGANVSITSNCKSEENDSNSSISQNGVVQWMVNFANDDTHGYSQKNRTMNPDVDCSSFVYYGLINGGGFTTKQLGSYPFTTSTMGKILEKNGFKVNKFTSISNLQEGDILWRSGHTEVYVGNGKNVGAHTDKDGKSGDSSGKEVDVSSTGTNWKYYYRYSG
jgi:SpoIID/LytB domain protein